LKPRLRDFEWQVADEGDVLFPDLLGDGEKGFARRHGDHFDEICSTLLQITHGSTGFFRIGNGILLGRFPALAREPRTGGDDLRTEEFARFDIALPGEKHIEIAAHIANAVMPLARSRGSKTSLLQAGSALTPAR